MGGCCHRRHVEGGARAVIDMGQHDDRDLVGDGGRDIFPRDGPDLVYAPEHRDQSFGHVDVGRKITGLGQDHFAVGAQRAGGGEQFEQIDRC